MGDASAEDGVFHYPDEVRVRNPRRSDARDVQLAPFEHHHVQGLVPADH